MENTCDKKIGSNGIIDLTEALRLENSMWKGSQNKRRREYVTVIGYAKHWKGG